MYMKAKLVFAITAAKLARWLCRVLNKGGTALPGRIAVKLCPDILKQLGSQVNTVCVTGTNGKTTTCRIIEECMKEAGLDYFANRAGANLHVGIVTEFIMNSTLSGRMKKHYCVMECDEAASVRIFADTLPKVITVTNLFADQVDRFGDVKGTASYIKKAIAQVPEAALVLNGDCPVSASLAYGMPNRTILFGFEETAVPGDEIPEKTDIPSCMNCGEAQYDYSYIVFDHLGGFKCPKCGVQRKKADIGVLEIKDQSASGSEIRASVFGKEEDISVNLPAVYNICNALAAIGSACALGIGEETAINSVAAFKGGFGRMEVLNLGKKGARMILAKNKAGTDQVIRYIHTLKEPFVLSFCLNHRISDGTDFSWIEEADYEGLLVAGDLLKKVYVSGECSKELYERLKEAGISEDIMAIENDYQKLARQLNEEDVQILVIPNYTAMMESRDAIIKLCGGDNFWE